MRILGADLRDLDGTDRSGTLVALDPTGAVGSVARIADAPALAREVGKLTGGEPFLLAVDVAVAGAADKSRRVDGWVRRRLGVRIPNAAHNGSPHVGGAELLTALATAGHPCLPYPD